MISALLVAALTTASAADMTVRDLQGQQVRLQDAPTAVLFWSIDDAYGRAALADLVTLAERGIAVVAVNTDALTDRARINAWLRANDIALPVIADADGDLQMRYRSSDDVELLVVAEGGQIVRRWSELDASGQIVTLVDALIADEPTMSLMVMR